MNWFRRACSRACRLRGWRWSLKTTPARPRIIPKGLFSEAALAWIVTSKFIDGLPLYRIAALLRRVGGDISRNT
ncbi:IS66 family transposase, partial [Burkholderia ubonensis]|uniref:IS66 family transposase n=1 Tax=Burkholderia ubonensis TaxID=101571 RepID=UPI0039F54016